jgi:hypothetical protein
MEPNPYEAPKVPAANAIVAVTTRWPLVATFCCAVLVLLAIRYPHRTDLESLITGPVLGLVVGSLVACFVRRRVTAVLAGLLTGIVLQGLTIAWVLWILREIP